MRIIAGKYKGLRLVNFKAEHIRPTTDRVKESLFNILQGDIEGSRVLDLFSGTGNLGFEAISRGAQHVCFVESNPKSLKIIRENIELLKIPRELYSIVQKDVFEFLQVDPFSRFDLIFIDPPFTEKIAHPVMLSLAKSQLFHDHTIVCIESAKKETMEDKYSSLVRIDCRNYGDKILSLFRLEMKEGTL